jgi:HEPN domain-containing protein
MERNNKAVIRNPLLALPAAHRIKSLPVEMRRELAALLTEMAQDAACRADKAWSKSKGPMAAYWKAVSVYAKHARVLCSG